MTFLHKKIGEKPEAPQLNLQEVKPSRFSFKFFGTKKKKPKKPKPKTKLQLALIFIVLVFAMYLVVYSIFAVYDYSSNKNFLDKIFKSVLVDLQKDEQGMVNILLVGQGGEGHDAPDLTDTIMIASIDLQANNVVMLSIPRDLWVNTEKFGNSRINEIYRNTKYKLEKQFDFKNEVAETEAMKILIKEIEKIINIKIPYFAKIDFKGFKEVIDNLGGITVEVEKDIYDSTYPDGNWGYEIFSLKAGTQILDAETALKYARSRHNSSDFDRAARQQKVIQAIKDKALSTGVITSPSKIKGTINTISKNFRSNLSIKELMTLAILSSNIPSNAMYSSVLNDNWDSKGGFLGTPPRSEYGGASVLIPVFYYGTDKYSNIHIFTELIFKHRDILFDKFEVLNGTMSGGLAYEVSKRLGRYGFNIVSKGNTPKGEDYKKSELWIYKENSSLFQIEDSLNKILPIKLVNKVGYYEETDVNATFIIGSDYK